MARAKAGSRGAPREDPAAGYCFKQLRGCGRLTATLCFVVAAWVLLAVSMTYLSKNLTTSLGCYVPGVALAYVAMAFDKGGLRLHRHLFARHMFIITILTLVAFVLTLGLGFGLRTLWATLVEYIVSIAGLILTHLTILKLVDKCFQGCFSCKGKGAKGGKAGRGGKGGKDEAGLLSDSRA